MATGVQWSGTQFSSGDRAYFVSVAHHPDAGGDEGSVDLALTDGEAAWTAAGAPPPARRRVLPCLKSNWTPSSVAGITEARDTHFASLQPSALAGLTSDALTGAARGKMAHLLAAVTELREAEPGIQYTCSAKPQGDGSMVGAAAERPALRLGRHPPRLQPVLRRRPPGDCPHSHPGTGAASGVEAAGRSVCADAGRPAGALPACRAYRCRHAAPASGQPAGSPDGGRRHAAAARRV